MWICPECRALYRTKKLTCQRDGFALVPVQANLSKAKYPLLEKVVDNRYQLIAGLGQGGLGTVYLAVHLRLDQLFAIKFLDLETVGIQADAEQSEEYRSDFMEEARVASLIHHDSVVRVTDFGDFERLPYLVMEFVAGTSLLSMLSHRGRFRVPEAINIAWSIAEALGSFHERKLIHRDLKPANVILDPRGNHLTLVDLGLVKDISGYGGKASTHPMALRGTPGYLAPEQVPSWVLSGISTDQSQTKQLVDARVDMYALGVMLYEMVAGVSPYPDGSNTQIIIYACTKDPLSLRGVDPPIDLPEDLEQLIYDTMARDPDRRPATAADFIERLKIVTGGERPRDWPEVIMLTQRSTLQGVLPPKREEKTAERVEPSLIDVFGDDSALDQPRPLLLDSDKTIEADTDSFNDTSFGSIDTRTSILGLDSRSRYQTTELKRSRSIRPSQDQTEASPIAMPSRSVSEVNAPHSVRNVSSATVGEYTLPSAERSGFRLGFYLMLVMVIGILGFLVFQRTDHAEPTPSNTESAQETTATAPSTPVKEVVQKVESPAVANPLVKAIPDAALALPVKSQVAEPIAPTVSVQVKAMPKKTAPKKAPKNLGSLRKNKITPNVVLTTNPKKVSPRPAVKLQPGRPHTRMRLEDLLRRGDSALGAQDCAGALTYYLKFLERAPTAHPRREKVQTRVEFCESKR